MLALPAMAQRLEQSPNDTSALRESIAAIVNENVITQSELMERFKLTLISSNLPDEPAVRRQFLPKILETLVDEEIQLQEASRLGITVDDTEVDMALQKIAADNRIDGDLRTYIAAQGGSIRALEHQTRAGLSWLKIIQRDLRPRVDVTDDEVEALIERQRSRSGQQEILVSEIFLSTDNAADAPKAEQFATRMREQLNQGAPFSALARQFSQGVGAAQGGDLGWIAEGQLPAELDQALQAAQDGELVGPIASPNGFHILLRRQSRVVKAGDAAETSVAMLQLMADGSDQAALIAQANHIRDSMKGCEDMATKILVWPEWRLNTLDDQLMSRLPKWVTPIAALQKLGEWSAPIPTNKGLAMLMVCARNAPQGPDREMIANALGTEKLEKLARRHLRDLKRATTIDLRWQG
ncbi:MAG: hypothetical protein EBQ89_05510 [Alphaproteobacteria bacterium]|nr:hypothetical protein [Alphaproteobacteria bacterium]